MLMVAQMWDDNDDERLVMDLGDLLSTVKSCEFQLPGGPPIFLIFIVFQPQAFHPGTCYNHFSCI